MIRHFFLDKTNSIFEGSTQNIGLNPVLHVAYGVGRVRGLIHFDIEQIKCLVDDKTFANLDKLSFNLKMTNYFSIDSFPYEKKDAVPHLPYRDPCVFSATSAAHNGRLDKNFEIFR